MGAIQRVDFVFSDLVVVSRIFASWNQRDGWLRQVEALL